MIYLVAFVVVLAGVVGFAVALVILRAERAWQDAETERQRAEKA